MTEIHQTLFQSIKKEELIASATVLGGSYLGQKMLIWADGRTQGDLGQADLTEQVHNQALVLIKNQRSEKQPFEISAKDVVEVFIEVYPPPPKLILVGAVHIAIPLVTFAKELGFRTIVIDARAAFATEQRFSHAHEMIVRWPAEALTDMNLDEASYVVFLTHDEKMDNPALEVVLNSPARYIGVLGSKKTQAKRVQALTQLGLTDDQLARIHAPIGLNLGGRRPEEIAVSIIAEIVSVRNSRH